MAIRFLGIALTALALSSCAEPSTSQLLDNATAPRLLSETMLYADISNRTINSALASYSPKFPLWSDGAAKHRWVYLPAAIDSTDPNSWVFPVGTAFFKEFTFHGQAVETRVLQKVEAKPGLESWVFSTYRWRADGSDAERVGDEGAQNVAPTEFPGVSHDIPNLGQCQRCHARAGEPILGFSATQLDARRNEYIPHTELQAHDLTNEKLQATNLLTKPVTHVQEDILDPLSLAAVGYLHGNCGSCHSPGGVRGDLGMNLSYDQNAQSAAELPIFKTAVNVFATPSEVTGGASDVYRIKAGDAEHSLLPKRLSARGSILQMPPFSSKVVDEDAVSVVRRWIEAINVPKNP